MPTKLRGVCSLGMWVLGWRVERRGERRGGLGWMWCPRRRGARSTPRVSDLLIVRILGRELGGKTSRPLSETPTSKETWAPLLSTANIPFSNSPVQFPCPFCNAISNTPSPPLEPGFLVVLAFERKNRGTVLESVHSATDTVSGLSFEGIENEGGFGSVSVLNEATALRDSCCAWTVAEMSRQTSVSGSIGRVKDCAKNRSSLFPSSFRGTVQKTRFNQ